MNPIQQTFKKLKGQAAFIPYLTAGYPNLATTLKLIFALEAAGADIIELGVPFSDPIADGPVIQMASQIALKKGATLKKIFGLVKKVRRRCQIPIVLMSYFNPVFHFGLNNFFKKAVSVGVDGLIIPDLPIEEGQNLTGLAKKIKIDLIFLAAPTTTANRLKKIISKTAGYLYYVSLTGVTGIRQNLAPDLVKKLKNIQKISPKPVAVGFGFSRPEQLRKIKPYVDGVIVGSALVKVIENNLKNPAEKLVAQVFKFARNLKKALS